MSEMLSRQIAEAKSTAVAASRAVKSLEQQMRPPRPSPSVQSILARALASKVLGAFSNIEPIEIARNRWPNDSRTIDALNDPGRFLCQRAAVNPAMSTIPGWAHELVQPNAGFIATIAPASAYSQLSARGIRVSLDGGGARIPGRASSPAPQPIFVGEGQPIAVRRAGLTSMLVSPYKAAVITSFSNEVAKYSSPRIEQLVRTIVGDETGLSIDSVLTDDQPASAIRPAGLLYAAVPVTASAATDLLAAMVADLRALIAAIEQSGPVVDPVFIVSTSTGLAMALLAPLQAAAVTLIVSPTVPSGSVIAVDANDFVSAEGEQPHISTSREALVHMEDTTPLPINAGAPASPVRSSFQEDVVLMKYVQPVSWSMLRPGRVTVVEDATW